MAKEPSTEEEQGRDDKGNERRIVAGMLRTYDSSTGLFGIRYSHGNR